MNGGSPRYLRWVLGLFLAGGMAQAWAVDWVQVEVIALQYPTPDPSAWVTSKTPDFSTATHLTVAESPGDPAVSIAYQQLPPSALKLAGAWRTLSRHGGGAAGALSCRLAAAER